MTKADLVAKIASKAGITKKQAGIALDTFTETVTKALKRKERVPLVGFGTFFVRKVKARTGRNPRTGATIKIPARHRPVFKPGRNLRESIK